MYYIGIDIGGTFVKLGIISEEGQIIDNKLAKTNFKCGYSITIKDIAREAIELVQGMGLDIKDIKGVGIGVPGTVHNGIVTFANNLEWYNVPIVDEFKRHLNTPINADNDANCAVLGEYSFGVAKGYNSVIMVTLGTGVGTGIIIDDRLIRGNKSAGAEGGHMVIRSNGIDCNCGRRGCWEEYAATTALIRITEDAIKEEPNGILAKLKEKAGEVNGFTLFDGVRAGDKLARKALDRYILNVAEGLVNLVNLLRPEIILIGGGVSNEEELLIKPLEALVNKYAYGGELNPPIIVKKALLGNKAGIVGAACLVMKN